MLADGSVYFLAVLLAGTQAAHGSDGIPAAGSPAILYTLLIAALFSTGMAFMYSFMGVYRQEAAGVCLRDVLVRTLLAVAVGMCIATGALFAIADGNRVLSLAIRATPLVALAAVLIRSFAFAIERAAVGARRILIIGTGKEAKAVASDIASNASVRHVVVGFYPTTECDATDTDRPGVFSRSLSIEQIIRQHRVREVIVAVGEQRGSGLPMTQLLACRIKGVRVFDLAGFSERVKGEVPIDSLKASWLVYGNGFAQGRLRRWVKRLFDIAFASVLLVATLPLMVLVALAIWIEDRGPAIYRQERVGLAGRVFICPKFRSMRVNAEQDGLARWACEDDDRITRVGEFIRKTRVDEIPQLFTVLRGEMSLIGPRPERPSFVAHLKEQIPFYDLRHSVQPGITGWAQVRYTYGASVEDARRKHQFDLYYVKNNSLFLDFLILIETVNVVLFREGAR